jgi:ferrous iron transport protein A
MRTTLDALSAGDFATVLEVGGDLEVAGRLMEMGVLPGTSLQVVRYAPLGDPMEVKARGYHLTLRRAEASGIVVEKM